ncbi:MAG: ribonuclease HII [Fimbriimonadales bacterium]|nr:MAG: ribonuclease HII [Fimbriimonadales bacterium]
MWIAGVDEAGRGPIAGPVVAACVILPPCGAPAGIADSKQLTPAQRERLCAAIKQTAVAWAIGVASPREIERYNILQASLIAMRRAVLALPLTPQRVLIDGKHILPRLPLPQQAVVDGDAQELSIAAASILAKVARDRIMAELDRLYPRYGFAQHKGYPTALHLERLRQYGACPAHRRTYAPVAQLRLLATVAEVEQHNQ